MASERMLQFVGREQSYPDKRSAEERARDFREIAERYAAPDADAQAARCSQCGVPYCSTHCPLHNHIPDWLRLTAEGRLREAGHDARSAKSYVDAVAAQLILQTYFEIRRNTCANSPEDVCNHAHQSAS